MTQQEGNQGVHTWSHTLSSCWWLLCQRKENLLAQSIRINIPGYRVHMRGEWNWKGIEKMPVHHSSNTEKQKVPLFQGFCFWQINFSHSYTARFWDLSFFSVFFSFIRSLCQYKNANLLPCWPSWGFFFFFFSPLWSNGLNQSPHWSRIFYEAGCGRNK